MIRLKKREWVLVYFVGGLVSVSVIGQFIVAPLADKLEDLDRSVKVQASRLKKGMSFLANQQNILDQYGKYAMFFSLQGASDEEVAASIMSEIDRISREAGVVIVDMKPQKETKTDQLTKQYLINIKAEGQMDQVIRFLHGLHNATLLLSAERMIIAPKGEDSPVLSFSMIVVGEKFL
jgi:hypothetical protein